MSLYSHRYFNRRTKSLVKARQGSQIDLIDDWRWPMKKVEGLLDRGGREIFQLDLLFTRDGKRIVVAHPKMRKLPAGWKAVKAEDLLAVVTPIGKIGARINASIIGNAFAHQEFSPAECLADYSHE